MISSLFLLLLAFSPNTFARTIEVPASVSELVRNCISGTAISQMDSRGAKGPKKVCYPDLAKTPGMSESDQAKLLDKVKRKTDGERIGSFSNGITQLMMAYAEDCERDFAQMIIENKLNGPGTLDWADAVVFSKQVKEPTVYINADPNEPSGGIWVMLPYRTVCSYKQKTVLDLLSATQQWKELNRLDRETSQVLTISKAFATPLTIFRTLQTPTSCQLEPFAQARVLSSVELDNEKRSNLDEQSSETQPVRETVLNTEVKRALDGANESQRQDLEAKLKKLDDLGITLALDSFSLKGKRLTNVEYGNELNRILNSRDGVDLDIPDAQRLIAEQAGLTGEQLKETLAVQEELRRAYLREYRKRLQIPDTKRIYFDITGAITINDLKAGCHWDAATDKNVCR